MLNSSSCFCNANKSASVALAFPFPFFEEVDGEVNEVVEAAEGTVDLRFFGRIFEASSALRTVRAEVHSVSQQLQVPSRKVILANLPFSRLSENTICDLPELESDPDPDPEAVGGAESKASQSSIISISSS